MTPPHRILVTGASSGIGRACAHLLSTRGAALALTARSAESLDEVRRECEARGATDVVVLPADVADGPAVDAVVQQAVTRLSGLDGVIHAAGALAYGEFTDIPAEVFDRIVATNVTGTANVARSALRHFRQQEAGSLVVVGSVLGKIAAPYMTPYCASKWALQGLVRTLQIEARRSPGVEIGLVTPGGVNTPIYDLAGSYTGHPGHPPPPVYSPERVAREVVATLDHPRRDTGVGLANPVMVLGFRLLPAAFDRMVGPLMRLLGQGRQHVDPHPGNVFVPRPELNGVRGRWPRVWG